MSKTIDEKVVSLQFENQNFEKNVRTSMSTLEKFKNAFKFDGAEKGIENVERAVKKFDMSPMSYATAEVSKSFTALEVVAINVLSNMATKAANAGMQLAKSLSVDQVMSGYSKYEQKTASVQTLVNSTGESIEKVNEWLSKLMWFSDETSYSFSDMTQSLAQLTSSGGKAEKLIPMIMGIANATAFAGKGTNEFSRAIYNLNQSYGSGALKYMDWKSLELAGVASKDLKQSFIETAIELGKLNAKGETAKGTLVELGNFGETLKEGWADTEVMEATFGKFYQYTEKAYEMIQEGQYETASDAYKALSLIYDDIYIKAAKSAQEAKTFTEAIEATKDAVSTKWMTTFDTLFGDYDKAKETWTNLANDLWEIFASGGDTRNEILGKAFKSDYAQLKDIFSKAGQDFDDFNKKYLGYLKESGWDIDGLIKRYGSLENAISKNADIFDRYKEKSMNLSKSLSRYISMTNVDFVEMNKTMNESADVAEHMQKIFDNIWSGVYGNGEERVKKLTEASLDYATVQKFINKLAEDGHRSGYKLLAEDVESLTDAELENMGITREQAGAIKEALEEVSESSKEAQEELQDLLSKMGRKSGQELLSNSISNITQSIIALKDVVKTAFANTFEINFSDVIYNAVAKLEEFTRGIKDFVTESKPLTKLFEGFFKVLKIVGKALSVVHEVVRQIVKAGLTVLNSLFKDLNVNIDDFAETVSDALDKAVEWLKNNEIIIESVEKAAKYATDAIGYVKKWIDKIVDLEKVSGIFNDVKDQVESLLNGDFLSKNTLVNALNKIQGTIEGIKNGTVNPFDAAKTGIKQFFDNAINSINSFKDTLGSTVNETLTKLNINEAAIEEFMKTIGRFSETVLGLGAGYLALTSFKKFAEAAASLLAPFSTISNVLSSVKGVFISISGYINASKASININNILKIAVAVGIIAGAMYTLASVGKSGQLWTAILATTALLGVITAFAWAINAIGNKNLGDKKAGANIKEITGLVLALGGAMVLIAASMKIMDGLEHGLNSMIAVIVLLGAVVVAANLIKRKVNVTSLFDLIGIALAIRILAGSLQVLDNVKLRNPVKVLVTIGSCIGALLLISYAARGVKGSSATILLGFVSSLYLLIKVMEKFNKISNIDYAKGLLRMIPAIAAIIAVMKAAKGMSKEAAYFSAVYMVGIAVALLTMAKSIETLSKMNVGELIKGGTAAVVLYGVIGAIGAGLVNLANVKNANIKSAVGAAIIMVTAAASLYIMAGAILIFKNLDTAGLAKAVTAIVFLLGALGGMMYLIGKGGLFSKDAQSFQAVNALAKVAVVIGVLAASIAVLAGLAMYNPAAFTTAIAGLILVVGSLAALMAVMTLYKNFGTMVTAVLGISSVLAAISIALFVLTNEVPNADKALIIAKSIADVAVGLGEAIVLVAAASKLSAGLSSVGGLLAGITAMTVIIGALAGLLTYFDEELESKGFDVDKMLDTFVSIMGKIGEALGSLAGNAIGGIVSGTMNQVVKATEQLTFIKNDLKDFGNLTFPETFGNTIDSLKKLFVTIGGNIGYIRNVAGLGSSAENLKTFFTAFGVAITAFSNSIAGINSNRVESAAEAGNMFAALNDSLKGGSIFDMFKEAGSNLGEFSGNMELFGKGLKTFSIELTGYNAEMISDKLPSVKELIALEADINNSKSLWGLLIGNKSLADFGKRAEELGEGLRTFSIKMGGFSSSAVDKAVEAGTALSELEKSISSSKNLMNLLTGEGEGGKNLGDFGNRIQEFGAGLVNGLNAFASLFELSTDQKFREPLAPMVKEEGLWTKVSTNIDRMIEIGERFNDLESTLSPVVGSSIFANESGLSSFGKGIKKFGEGFRDFASTIPETMPDNQTIQDMINISRLLVGFSGEFSENTDEAGNILSSIGSTMNNAGGFFSNLVGNIANTDLSMFSSEGGLMNTVRSLFMNEEMVNGLHEDGEAVTSTYIEGITETLSEGSEVHNKARHAFDDFAVMIVEIFKKKKEKMVEIGENYIQGIIDGMAHKEEALYAKAQAIADRVTEIIGKVSWESRSPSKVAYKLGAFYVQGIANGISDLTPVAVNNAETMALEVSDAVKNAIDASSEVLEDSLSPFIKPVLDTSNVLQGANSINGLLGAYHNYDAVLGISSARMLNNQNGLPYGSPINVNIDFTINNDGKDLTYDDIQPWIPRMTNEINIRLGKLIKI